MPETPTAFIAYCYPDKKWFDRVQAAIPPELQAKGVAAWDERKFQFGNAWRGELAQLLSGSKIAVLLVSDRFLESDFMNRAKFGTALKSAVSEGLKVRWVLLSHCLHEQHGLEEADALNDLDSPLDGLGAARRDEVLADIAQRVAEFASGQETIPAPRLNPSPVSLHEARLGPAIEARKETAAIFRRWKRGLGPAAAAIVALAFVVGIAGENLSLLLVVAGYGLFIGTLAKVIKMRIDLADQSVVGARCVKTGLADAALPERQRNTLLQKAKEFLGGI